MAYGKLILVLAAFAVCVSTTALAGPVDQGRQEFSGSFAWATTSYSYKDYDLVSETILTLNPRLGYFVADGFELLFGVPLTFMSIEDDSFTTLGAQIIGIYHFAGNEALIPYIGAGLGTGWAFDDDDSDYETTITLPSVHLGARSFLTESACFTTEFVYNHQINGLYAEDVSGNLFGITAGFSFFF